MSTNCEACGGRMNEVAVVCPHCGEKREVAPAVFSRQEIQALLATDQAAQPDSTAMLKALLLPHPASHGVMRILELALGAVAAPAILLGALGMFMFGRRRLFVGYGTARERSQAMLSTTGEIAPVVVMTVLGGGAFSMFGGDYALIAIVAMWARAGVRLVSTGKRERELIEEDKKKPNALPPSHPVTARPSAPQLPEARVVSAPSRPSAPVQPMQTLQPVQTLHAKSHEPQEDAQPHAPGDEPSILR